MLKKLQKPGSISVAIAKIENFIGRFPLNDPTTPHIFANKPTPEMGPLKYAVDGMGSSSGSASALRAMNCHFHIGHCLNSLQALIGRPVHSWASSRLLRVVPAAGADMNAYYDRKSLRFFYHNHRGRNFYFSDSSDIITHELGHAFLDAMRPDFWSVQALEIWSFHEAFSDIVAVFNFLSHEESIDKVLEETGGEIGSSNYASRLAEEVGVLIREVTGDKSYLKNALRDPAVERFLYVPPSTLPKDARNDRLAAECHSFGRVFSAAWYEAFVRTYNYEVSSGKNEKEALKEARDLCMSVLLSAAVASPRVSNYYEAVAKCMISIASNRNARLSTIFKDVFSTWGIIKFDSMKKMSNKSWGEVISDLQGGDSVIKTENSALVVKRRNSSRKLSELGFASSLSFSGDFKIEVPLDKYYEFDLEGNLIEEIESDLHSNYEDIQACMQFVNDDFGKNGMWGYKMGRIERNFFS